jgi:superfamily II DNA or RNA helicase
VKITVLNSVFSQIDEPERVKHLLAFQKEFWKASGLGKRKTRIQYTNYMIEPKKGIFFTGFVPRIAEWAKRRNIPLEICDNREDIKINRNFCVKGIKLRDDQISLIEKALDKKRGLLVAPTGSGKTVVAAGIISSFTEQGSKILFLCHTVSLLKQTVSEFKKAGFVVTMVGDGSKDIGGQVVVATMQTFGKLSPEDYRDSFSVVIVDEAHHISSEKGTYHKILKNTYAPIRIGFTATPPVNPEAKLVCEGLLGEIIGETTLEEGKEKEFLSEPKVKLISIPRKETLKDLKLYKDIYDYGIVKNKTRNRMIIDIVKNYNRQGKTCLVYVNRIDHLELLMSMGEENWEKVLGETEGEDREALRQQLDRKTVMCVISTTVWKEGVNIPSLDVIINAAGGKSEISVLQTIGRGLRRTKEKDTVTVVDFLDLGKYLSEHTVERLSIYSKNGWL